MQVQLIVQRGAATQSTPRRTGADSAKIMRTLTVFKDLVNVNQAEQTVGDRDNEHYRFLRELQKVSSATTLS